MDNMRMKAAVLLAALLTFSGASAQAVRTVYIDPISGNGPASWNNLSFGVSNNTAVLKDSLTNSTGIRATVTRNMNPGANANASATVLTIPGAQFEGDGASGSVGAVRYRRPVPSLSASS